MDMSGSVKVYLSEYLVKVPDVAGAVSGWRVQVVVLKLAADRV